MCVSPICFRITRLSVKILGHEQENNLFQFGKENMEKFITVERQVQCLRYKEKNFIAYTLMVFLFLAINVNAFDFFWNKKDKESPLPLVAGTPVAPNAPVSGSSQIVKNVMPSIVTVFTTKKIKMPDPRNNPFFQGPFFHRFFGSPNDNEKFPPPSHSHYQEQKGLGSGVIISKDGYIITNNHVVDMTDEIKVQISEKRKDYIAKIIGKDPHSDIAIIKIDTTDLRSAELGDSDKLEVGDDVLAMGNPFGIGLTVTKGIVSALSRNLPMPSGESPDTFSDFIQTDAAINPGNSGGALVNSQGQVVGINTAIFSTMGPGNIGIGFAIPINLVKNIMSQLIKNGKVVRGFLGVGIQNLNPDLAKEFKLDLSEGALVSNVTAESPAEKAGIKQGDVITSVNGKKVSDAAHLRLLVTQLTPGTHADINVIRDGKEKTLEVKLGELNEAVKEATELSSQAGGLLEGVEIADLTPEIKNQLKLPPDTKGVVVNELSQENIASGLRQGDVIAEIDHHEIKNVKEALKIIKSLKEKKALLRVIRDGQSFYLILMTQ